MMKKILILVMALFSLTFFAQVGIGTTSPASSSILDLTATNKALLLPRVANTAAVTTPVNGMMVYDVSANCVKGYENGAWTGCISAGGSTPVLGAGGDWGFDFTSTVKQMSSSFDNNGAYSSGLISTDGKIFLWGRNFSQSFFTGSEKFTPVYSPLPNGELAKKIALGGWCAMALTTTGKVYIMGSDTQGNGPVFGNIALPRVWTLLTIAGETTFEDVQSDPYGRNSFIRATSGKVYRCGYGNTFSAPEKVSTYTAMLFPTGVTSYIDMWCDTTNGVSALIYFKGNDNNIYAAGTNNFGQLGNGNTTNVNLNVAPVKVQFPAGVNIVKISHSGSSGVCLALSNVGTAYAWGRWKYDTTDYLFAATPVVGALSGNNLLLPSPIALPTLNSDTKFTDVIAGSFYSIVRTDKMVYYKGYNCNNILMNPVTSNQISYGSFSPSNALSGSTYDLAAPTWNQFKTFITGGSSSSASVFAISFTDKPYSWGAFSFAISGTGAGQTTNLVRPTPIATGIGDPLNPNPLY